MKSFIEFREELSEAKDQSYQIYHGTLSAAMREVEKQLAKQGLNMEEESYYSQVTTGDRKPSKGKTNKYHVRLEKNSKPIKKQAHIQVYNRGTSGNTFELNMYVS